MPKLKIISPQQARDARMFGPLYHGTTDANMKEILKSGFKIFVGSERSGEISHGYTADRDYAWGAPAPVHHLGFGIYFTTKKAIAKEFGYGNTPKHPFYITEHPHEINFGSANTMMKWWVDNGYDIELAKKDRVAATKKLTNALKKYKAIWFKGQGLYKLLDGDQVVVFDLSIIRGVDPTLAKGMEVGARVEKFQEWVFKGNMPEDRGDQSKWELQPVDPPKTGRIVNIRHIPEQARQFNPPGAEEFLEVKFDKKGRDVNAYRSEFRPYESKRTGKSKFKVESAVMQAARMVTENHAPTIESMEIEPEWMPGAVRRIIERYIDQGDVNNRFTIAPQQKDDDVSGGTSATRVFPTSQLPKGQDASTTFRQKAQHARKFLDRAVQMMDQGSLAVGDLATLAKDELKMPVQKVVRAIIQASQEVEDIAQNSLKSLEDTAVKRGSFRAVSDIATRQIPNRQAHAKRLMAAMARESLFAESLEDGKLIHVARWSLWKQIQKEGLKARCEDRGMHCDNPGEARIYLFEDSDTAEDALSSWMLEDMPKWDEEHYAALIEVDTSGMDVQEDPEIGGSYYVTSDIPASRMKLVRKEDLGPSEDGVVREGLLLEKKGATYKHAVAMFDMPAEVAEAVKQWQKDNVDEEDVYVSEEDNSLGLEDEIHATILYGLRNEDLKKIKELVADFGPVELELDGLNIFDNADNDRPFEVLNVNVKGKDIGRLHKLLKDNVENQHKWPDFKAHVCIGYLKKGTGKKYKDMDPPFEGKKVVFDSFSFKAGGSKKRKKRQIKLSTD